MMRKRMDHRAVGDRDAGTDHHERLDRDILAERGIGGEINRLGRDHGHAGLERRLAQPRLHDLLGLGELGLGVDAAHFILAGFDHDGLQSQLTNDVDRIAQIILALAVGIADLFDDLQRPAAVERHHAGIAEFDLAFRRRRVGVLRGSPPAGRPRPAAGHSRSGSAARKPSTASAAPFFSGARRRSKVAAEISGVSPNTTSRSSAPRAMASRAASTACAVPRRSCWTKVAASGRRRLTSSATAAMVRSDHHGERGAGSLWARRRAHAPAATGRPPDAAPWASRSACACPRRPRARSSGWIERSSESLYGGARLRRRRHKAFLLRHGNPFRRQRNAGEFRIAAHFLLMFAAVIRRRPREGRERPMAKDSDHLAGSFETENTGGLLTGFLAEEDDFDRRTLWRLGSWGAARSAPSSSRCMANQSSIGLRRDQVAAADLARQSQQIQSVAKESQNEARRLASAIETLNGDRDRLYSRVTVLEQGLEFGDRRDRAAKSCPKSPRHRRKPPRPPRRRVPAGAAKSGTRASSRSGSTSGRSRRRETACPGCGRTGSRCRWQLRLRRSWPRSRRRRRLHRRSRRRRRPRGSRPRRRSPPPDRWRQIRRRRRRQRR